VTAPLLDIAIQSGQIPMVELLLSKGADSNLPDSRGQPPLIWAVVETSPGVSHSTRVAILKALLSAKAEPDSKSESYLHWSALCWAAVLGDAEMADVLLNAGADPNLGTDEGQTPLHLAANSDVAKRLLAAGANPAARTFSGKTPFDSARENGLFSVMAVLTNSSPTLP